MSVYPTTILTIQTFQDEIDVVAASIANTAFNEIIATQAIIGTNPQGSKTDLTTRLGVLIATNGAFAQGTAFPVTGLLDGQGFYRTDLNGYYIYNGSTWDLQGGSLSNCLFHLNAFTNSNIERYTGTIFNTSGAPVPNLQFNIIRSATFATMWHTKWTKIAGVSTVKVYAELWGQNSTADVNLRVDIGTAFGTLMGAVGSTRPVWSNPCSIDVTGLTAGTNYDVVVSTSKDDSNNSFLGELIGFGS